MPDVLATRYWVNARCFVGFVIPGFVGVQRPWAKRWRGFGQTMLHLLTPPFSARLPNGFAIPYYTCGDKDGAANHASQQQARYTSATRYLAVYQRRFFLPALALEMGTGAAWSRSLI
jgi:hypothetical protein